MLDTEGQVPCGLKTGCPFGPAQRFTTGQNVGLETEPVWEGSSLMSDYNVSLKSQGLQYSIAKLQYKIFSLIWLAVTSDLRVISVHVALEFMYLNALSSSVV